MGVALAGIAFNPSPPEGDMATLVSELFGLTATSIVEPNAEKFDTRNPSDVLVQEFGNSCFVCNNDLAWNVLERPTSDVSHTYRSLGSPSFFMVFCCYDSGGSYGYAFIENGQLTRSRLQTTGLPQTAPLIEYGAPREVEQRWLNASFYIEEDDGPSDQGQKIFYQGQRKIQVPEYYLTSRILKESLLERFGICPWDTDAKPVSHFFRLKAKAKSWWRG